MITLEFKQKITSNHIVSDDVCLIVSKENAELDDYIETFNAFLKSCGFETQVDVRTNHATT